jgi:tRNA dimethylallyltransferase
VLAILGPTGSGKSDTAFELAQILGGEIVVCDSRQVYDRLDIATNKPDIERRAQIRHHLIGVADPVQTFNVFEFVTLAKSAIQDIARRRRLPILEGGSMLWADALLDGFSLAGLPPRPERRAELEQLTADELAAILRGLDPQAQVDFRNPVRLVRAIEVLEISGSPLARLRRRQPPDWDVVRIGLTAPLEVIEARLALRSRVQVARGLVEETRAALAAGVPETAPVLSGIGYAEALSHIRGEISLQELPEAMTRSNRRYAVRQLRWLRKDPRIRWFDIESQPLPAMLSYLNNKWYGDV